MSAPTILLVEDNQLLRWWMTSSLQRDGWLVSSPQTAEEALTLASSQSFAVVITDWRLSEGHLGCEILSRVRESSPATVAILISAEAGSAFKDQACARGFDLVIEKPFPLAEILGAVHHLAGRMPAKAVS